MPKILGAALTLFLTLSANPAKAQDGSRASPSGDETLVQDWIGKRYAKIRRLRDFVSVVPPAGWKVLDDILKSPKTVSIDCRASPCH
jgi:hypothetical protein